MLVFGILVGAAFYFRRQLDIHKRLMLLATITLMPAAVARLPFDFILNGGPLVFFGLSDLFILPCLIYDWITRGVHIVPPSWAARSSSCHIRCALSSGAPARGSRSRRGSRSGVNPQITQTRLIELS
jgi:hypothetical protein